MFDFWTGVPPNKVSLNLNQFIRKAIRKHCLQCKINHVLKIAIFIATVRLLILHDLRI